MVRNWCWVVAATACTTTTQLAPPTVDLGVTANHQRTVMEMVRLALVSEPGGSAPAHLFGVGATFVANGRERHTPPRYAGLGRGGTLRVTGLSGEVFPPHAYAVASYQWDAADGSAAETGRASFVLQLRNDRWEIRHVHSSMILPWDQNR